MLTTLRALAPCFLLAATAPAQGYPAGFRDLAFPNTTGQGSATIPSTVYYPAQSAGRDAPILSRSGGWPVVVFLHGFAALGSLYPSLGESLARDGFVTVLHNTAQFAAVTQVQDGIALFTALVTANGQTGNALKDALDMSRAGVAGHSMGGGSTVNVLASNPGYKAGLCFAPVSSNNTALVRVPLGVVHGTGDTIVSWQQGLGIFQGATGATGMRFLYQMNADCSHTNVAGILMASQTDRDVFARTSSIAAGFFARYLGGDVSGLERVIGPTARAESRLVQLYLNVLEPELWGFGSTAIGQSPRLTLAAQPGPAGIFAAAGEGNLSTVFGTLRLDPATAFPLAIGTTGQDWLYSVTIPIPNDVGLVGAKVPFQGVGGKAQSSFGLTGLWRILVTQ